MKKYRPIKKIQKMISYRRLRARAHHNKWKLRSRREIAGIAKQDRFKERARQQTIRENTKLNNLPAPENFSFNDNTNEVVQFISDIEELYRNGKGVFVNLKNVINIDYGSIVTLLSVLVQFRKKKIDINGNYPANEDCSKILRESGFIYNLYKKHNDDELGCISNGSDNIIQTHYWKKVNTELSASIIKEASLSIWGGEKRCQGVQRCIGELMLNTNNHANPVRKGDLNWWLYVNHDNQNKTVSFAFVDFGIGIFESLKRKPVGSKFHGWLEKVKDKIIHGNPGILKMIMSGDFHRTVTGKYYRGKGLPGIAEAFNRNQLSHLMIVSNNVIGDVESGDYRKLSSSFSGTYVYWELNENNEHCEL